MLLIKNIFSVATLKALTILNCEHTLSYALKSVVPLENMLSHLALNNIFIVLSKDQLFFSHVMSRHFSISRRVKWIILWTCLYFLIVVGKSSL